MEKSDGEKGERKALSGYWFSVIGSWLSVFCHSRKNLSTYLLLYEPITSPGQRFQKLKPLGVRNLNTLPKIPRREAPFLNGKS